MPREPAVSTPPLILDAEALSQAAGTPGPRLRALLAEAERRGADVQVAAVTCAEVARGRDRTRALEARLARRGDGEGPIEVVPTGFALARHVGAILHAAGAGSEDLADAHPIALGVVAGGGVIATSDPEDLSRLADTVPAIRLVIRPV
jgi:predicted nucleic acid-binding protein